MAVTSSVVEDTVKGDVVAVALREPETTVAETLPDREAKFGVIIRLLG
jgi:hypothetical protein